MADKLHEARMAGMNMAYNIVKQDGIEGLEQEIRRRNILQVPVHYTKTQIQKIWDDLSKSMYNNMLTVVLYTLHWQFGFGKQRLTDYMKAFYENTKNVLDLDYLGEHYVTMADYAKEVNDKCKCDVIDIIQVASDEKALDERDGEMTYCKLEGVIYNLRRNGFDAAAEHLEKAKGMLKDKERKS